MKFVISSSALLSVLSATGKVVSSKNTLPILDYFLFNLSAGVLTVTASDLETTMVSTVTVDKMESEGLAAVPVKLMLDSLKEFSEQPLTIESREEGQQVKITISWRSGSLNIPGVPAMSYPSLPVLEGEMTKINVDVDTLLCGINKTIFATADDDLRPVMSGVYVNFANDEITFVATDAHKLVKYATQTTVDHPSSFILPKKPSNLLRQMLLKEEEPVELTFDKKNATFTLHNSKIVCRLIEGVYPNYNAVIPAANPNKVIVDRTELLNAIKHVSVCSNQATNLVKFAISGNNITLTAEDNEFSYNASDSLSCAYEGDDITIGFKSTFLIDILSNIETPSIVIELADSTRAGVFKPIYDDEPKAQTLMLLMPMMMNA